MKISMKCNGPKHQLCDPPPSNGMQTDWKQRTAKPQPRDGDIFDFPFVSCQVTSGHRSLAKFWETRLNVNLVLIRSHEILSEAGARLNDDRFVKPPVPHDLQLDLLPRC
ncbi:hypothetical protein AC578_6593 [Pseudocercospora eumusae]|uniref:Uncharacterized protein n=1 Tax=Pseudocercospora eumusae TaxID=321146 RepID=A0A139GVZ1_9PEZI|nr:hypothetical protein AC578_6593 [Pseudocercospora eumusae]